MIILERGMKAQKRWSASFTGLRNRARALRAIFLVALVPLGFSATAGFGDVAWASGRLGDEDVIEAGAVDDFYDVPNPIPSGAPGQLIRSEQIKHVFDGAQAWRMLYHSTDVQGNDILVSGVAVAPDEPAPTDGRTIISWGHPTTGTAQRCAPSLGIDPFDTIEGLRELVGAGYVVVATDYSGMGAVGPPSYLIGVTEGNNILDAARAARQLPQTGASDRLVLWGHSQGGHAVLFAAQSAAQYAPDLQLKGVAVAAPATNLGELLNDDIGDVSGVTISAYAFAAYSQVYTSTPGTTLDTILTPAGVAATPTMNALCLLSQNRQIHTIAKPLVGNYLSGDPATVQPWATLLAQNTPGAVGLSVPLFVAQGETDTLVRPEVTQEFVDQEQRLGTVVTYVSLPNTGHAMVALRALPQLSEWLDHGLAETPIHTHPAKSMDIGRARGMPLDSIVTVKGTVTVPSGAFTSGTLDAGFAIEDKTGGIYVSIATDPKLHLRDIVEVTGTLADSSGQLILIVNSSNDLHRKGHGRRILPQRLATNAIGAATEGRLVRVVGAITQPVVNDLPYGYRLFVDDGSGKAQVYVYASTGIDESGLKPGQKVRVTGFASKYIDRYEIDCRILGDIRVR